MEERLHGILWHWGLTPGDIRTDIELTGSPERSLSRVVVETDRGLVILEQVPEEWVERKQRIASTLQALVDHGLGNVHPYLPPGVSAPVGSTEHLLRLGGNYWQLRPFVAGHLLPRPAYSFDEWRGVCMADFLMDLRTCAESAKTKLPNQPVFNLKEYAFEILPKMERRSPGIIDALAGLRAHLTPFWRDVYPRLPRTFCHGDFHPVNVIWGDKRIESVIDWEFCGPKVEGYDAALLLGCLGYEDPDHLLGEMAIACVKTLRGAGVFTALTWESLPELVMAIRFGWLREWIWRGEADALELELAFLDVLIRNADNLRDHWRR
ncbi:MAG: aminoglycoside phosphotransferase family protein [Lentisphaeria bacterium]|nr:aminoglycoside phosphotransferase family protein [Lentisphaeria bacterium]